MPSTTGFVPVIGMSESGTGYWQIVEITGVGLGEMWFDVVADELSRDDAESRASRQKRHVAVPMPYNPDPPAGIGEVVDDYEREVVER